MLNFFPLKFRKICISVSVQFMIRNITTDESRISWATILLVSATFVQLQYCDTPNQQAGDSNPENLNSFFLVEFLLHSVGNLIETAAALLAASLIQNKSGRGADMRKCYSYSK